MKNYKMLFDLSTHIVVEHSCTVFCTQDPSYNRFYPKRLRNLFLNEINM